MKFLPENYKIRVYENEDDDNKVSKDFIKEKDFYAVVFENEYGEDFILEHNGEYGFLSGSETDWKKYWFVNDTFPKFHLNFEESKLFFKALELIKTKTKIEDFLKDNNYHIQIGKKYTYLTDDDNNEICPICFDEVNYGNIHHGIPACEGGSDENTNLLQICKKCHMCTHHYENNYTAYEAIGCLSFLYMVHGFYVHDGKPSKRYKGYLPLYESHITKIYNNLIKLNNNEQLIHNETFKISQKASYLKCIKAKMNTEKIKKLFKYDWGAAE